VTAPAMYEGADGVAYLNAAKEWHVTETNMGPGAVGITAAAGTGWRYDVVVSYLTKPIAGGQYIVSVLSPWQATYPLGDPYGVRAEDVVDKLVPLGSSAPPADVAAVTATINYALEKLRDHYLPREN
jgi:hypothetical protein